MVTYYQTPNSIASRLDAGAVFHYRGEAWYCLKRTISKNVYRNRTSELQLTINFKTGKWTIKRLMPKVRVYGNVPNAWCVDAPKQRMV